MIFIRASILAVVLFIPFYSIQHFIEPLDDCLLADICNHTWIPECGFDEDIKENRLFLDECDIWEYNCDFDMDYVIVNYSDCFGPQTCPTLPPWFTTTKKKKKTPKKKNSLRRHGNYLYDLVLRTFLYDPTTTKRDPKTGKRRYTPIRGRKARKLKTFSSTPCAPCMRGLLDTVPTRARRPKKKRTFVGKPTLKRAPKPTPKSIPKPAPKVVRKSLQTMKTIQQNMTMARFTSTKQIIHTATVGTVILKTATFFVGGSKLYKVIKGFPTKLFTATTTSAEDSDFLDNH